MTQSKHKNTPDRSTEWQSIKYLITSPQNCQDHGNIRNETLSDKETETSWENAVRFPELDPETEKKKKKKTPKTTARKPGETQVRSVVW